MTLLVWAQRSGGGMLVFVKIRILKSAHSVCFRRALISFCTLLMGGGLMSALTNSAYAASRNEVQIEYVFERMFGASKFIGTLMKTPVKTLF